MIYKVRNKAINEIRRFYRNVAIKYSHTYAHRFMIKNITDAYDAIYQIENGLSRRKPTISRWKGFYMASYTVGGQTRWNFAYRIEGDTIYVEDACHAQNMHESKKVIRLTESELKQIIKECIIDTITEDINYENTSYQVPPKNGKKLNDWELFNIINSIIKQMIIDKQITSSDGDMLMHYSLYNNDCYGLSSVTSQR